MNILFQGFEEDENNHVVHVISLDNSECTRNLTSIPKVTELNLICATLSGHLDPSVFVSPPGNLYNLIYIK